MKFLITGAYGFVGTNLCKYLTGKGHVCDALDIPAARREDVPYETVYAWDDLNHGLTQISTDCKNREIRENPCQSVVDFSQYDCVVHLAGKAHDLKKVASEQSYFDINVGLTQKIFAAFLNHGLTQIGTECGVKTFIYFSSSKASADGNAYGRSKLAAEEWLKGESVKLRDNPWLRTVILRPAMIHGPGNKGNLNLLWGLARRGLPWPLAAFENKRSFTSIGNICAAVEALAKTAMSDDSTTRHSPPNTHAFFIADDAMLSTNRLIELIAEECGKKAKLWRLPKSLMMVAAKAGDILHLPLNTERLGKLTEDSFVDNVALKKALGWSQMPIAAEDGMRTTLKSFS